MASNRKDLKGIAGGIASSFISRNNDINGYWALGILYKRATEKKLINLKFDILNLKMIDSNINADFTLEFYHKFLLRQLKLYSNFCNDKELKEIIEYITNINK